MGSPRIKDLQHFSNNFRHRKTGKTAKFDSKTPNMSPAHENPLDGDKTAAPLEIPPKRPYH
jgi:hypothetical protein